MKKKKFSWKSFSVLLGIVLLLAAAAAPHYVWTLERSRAGAAEAALVNAAAAENLYFINHKTYTRDWKALERYIPETGEMQGVFAPAGEPGEERFFSFSQEALSRAEDGFSFGIEISQDGKEGKVYAVRAGGPAGYTLSEAFPQPVFACDGDGMAGKWFCGKFSKYIEPFIMRKTAAEPGAKQTAEPAAASARE